MSDMFPIDKQPEFTSFDKKAGLIEETVLPDRMEDINAVIGEDVSTEDAKNIIARDNANAIDTLLTNALVAKNVTADELQLSVDNHVQKQEDFMSNPQFVAEQALTQKDTTVSALDARVATNYRIAEEIVSKKVYEANNDKGIFGGIVDGLDRFVIRNTLMLGYEDLTDRTSRKGTGILSKAAALPPKEFRKWFQEYANEVSQEGVFTSDNMFSAMQLQEEVGSMGFDPDSEIKKMLGVLDVFGGAEIYKLAFKATRGTLKATTTIGRVAAQSGPDAGAEAGLRLVANSSDPEALGNLGPGILDTLPQVIPANESRFTAIFSRNKIAQGLQDLYNKGVFGRIATQSDIESASIRMADDYLKRITRPVFKTLVNRTEVSTKEGFLGNYESVIQIGKPNGGSPYKALANGDAPASVKNLAKKLEGAEVVKVDPDDVTKGYVIQIRQRIPTSGLPQAINPDELIGLERGLVRGTLGRLFGNSIMGNAAVRDVERLSTLAQLGEAGGAAVKELVRPYTAAIKRLNASEAESLQAVYANLRDGIDAELRLRYTPEEFAQEYAKFHPKGLRPTEDVTKAYEALAELEDFDYLLKANKLLQRYIDGGYKTVEVVDGFFTPAKQVARSSVPDDAKIVEGGTNARLRKVDFEENDLPIWKLSVPTKEGQEYVISPRSVREVDPSDVMGYNPGGSRVNPTAKYFVTIAGGRLKALLGTFSETEAKLAQEQLSTIQRALRAGDPNLDEIIKNNNDWHTGIQNATDLAKVADEEGWDLTRGEIGYKNRDGDMLGVEVGDDALAQGFKVAEYIANDMRRNNRVLLDFGGSRLYNEDPVTAITAQLGNSIHTFANRAYTQNAIVGWVKKAQKANRNWFPSGISTSDYNNLFKNANISGNDSFARRMRELHDLTNRRIGMKDDVTKWLESFGGQLSEYIFDKTALKLNIGDPSNTLLKVGFQSAFGFLNPAQLFMQSFHITTIMAISPKYGYQAAGLVSSIRGLLHTTPEALELGIKRLANNPKLGLSENDARELIEYIRTSGRAVVDGDAIESGTGVGFGISGWRGESLIPSTLRPAAYNMGKYAGKALDLGLMPFNLGERLSRLTAMTTAFLEFKASNRGISALSDQGRSFITRREQNLTFNMTTASRASVQAGWKRVPTQWLSYTLNSMATVFVGRDLTGLERARLATVLFPMYGLTGFGMGSAADYISEKVGIPADSPWFTTLKSGLIDGLMDALPVPDISVGTRLAPFGAITETWRKITQESTTTALFGPSGEIAGSISSAFLNSLDELIHGRPISLSEDLITVLRQPSALDNTAKALGIWNNGVYRSKYGATVPGEMTVGDGLNTLFGFQPLKVAEWYSYRTKAYNSSKDFSAFRKEVNMDAEKAFTFLQGNYDSKQKGISLMYEIHAKIALSGFSSNQMASLRGSASRPMTDNWVLLQKQFMAEDRQTELSRLRSTLFDGENN
jgi:hypothetical protein